MLLIPACFRLSPTRAFHLPDNSFLPTIHALCWNIWQVRKCAFPTFLVHCLAGQLGPWPPSFILLFPLYRLRSGSFICGFYFISIHSPLLLKLLIPQDAYFLLQVTFRKSEAVHSPSATSHKVKCSFVQPSLLSHSFSTEWPRSLARTRRSYWLLAKRCQIS